MPDTATPPAAPDAAVGKPPDTPVATGNLADDLTAATPTPAKTDPPASTSPKTDPPKPDDATDESEGEFREMLKADYGFDASKYKSDDEALKGILETALKVGERDEDAKVGKEMKELLAGREDEFYEWAEKGKSTKTQPGDEDELPDHAQYELLAAKATGENATDADKAKYAKVQQTLTKRVFDLARGKDKRFSELESQIETMRTEGTADKKQQAFLQHLEKDNEVLFVDGDRSKYTPYGEIIKDISAAFMAEGMDPDAAYEKAVEIEKRVAGNQTPKPVKRPGGLGGRRVPAVASPEPTEPDLDKMMEKEGLASVLAKMSEARKK